MPTQRDLAHVNDPTADLWVAYHSGNANIAAALVAIDGQQIPVDANGLPFQESVPFNLGPAGNLIGKTVEIFADLAQNPGVQSNTLILSYDVSNVSWLIPGKSRTLTSTAPLHDTFDVLVGLI